MASTQAQEAALWLADFATSAIQASASDAHLLQDPKAVPYLDVVEFIRDIKPGYHIAVYRGDVWHHGIYVGIRPGDNGQKSIERVVHIWGKNGKPPSNTTAIIRQDTLSAFMYRHFLLAVIVYEDGLALSDSVRLANGFYDHNVLFRNREHFATWCKTLRCEKTLVQQYASICNALSDVLAEYEFGMVQHKFIMVETCRRIAGASHTS